MIEMMQKNRADIRFNEYLGRIERKSGHCPSGIVPYAGELL